MKKDANNYLNNELDFFKRAYEIQFTHFMQVFYFWTLIIVLPVTSGLLSKITQQNYNILQTLFFSISIIGFFLSAKMFDIRASQLSYIAQINQIREIIYQELKSDLPKNYKRPFLKNLRKTAMKDFGIWMAIIMSAVNSVLFGLGISFLQSSDNFNYCACIISFVIGFGLYPIFIYSKVPNDDQK